MVFCCLLLTLMDHLPEVVFLGLLHCSYSFHFMIDCCSAEIKDQISQIELSAGSVENTLAREENYSSSLLDQNCLNRQSIDLVCFLDQSIFSSIRDAFVPSSFAFPCWVTSASMAGVSLVGGTDHFPGAGQSQHFCRLKTDADCASTLASLRKDSEKKLHINSRQSLHVCITHWIRVLWLFEKWNMSAYLNKFNCWIVLFFCKYPSPSFEGILKEFLQKSLKNKNRTQDNLNKNKYMQAHTHTWLHAVNSSHVVSFRSGFFRGLKWLLNVLFLVLLPSWYSILEQPQGFRWDPRPYIPLPKGGVMYSSPLGVEPTSILWTEKGEGMDAQTRKENDAEEANSKGTAIWRSDSKASRLVYFTFDYSLDPEGSNRISVLVETALDWKSRHKSNLLFYNHFVMAAQW